MKVAGSGGKKLRPQSASSWRPPFQSLHSEAPLSPCQGEAGEDLQGASGDPHLSPYHSPSSRWCSRIRSLWPAVSPTPGDSTPPASWGSNQVGVAWSPGSAPYPPLPSSLQLPPSPSPIWLTVFEVSGLIAALLRLYPYRLICGEQYANGPIWAAIIYSNNKVRVWTSSLTLWLLLVQLSWRVAPHYMGQKEDRDTKLCTLNCAN